MSQVRLSMQPKVSWVTHSVHCCKDDWGWDQDHKTWPSSWTGGPWGCISIDEVDRNVWFWAASPFLRSGPICPLTANKTSCLLWISFPPVCSVIGDTLSCHWEGWRSSWRFFLVETSCHHPHFHPPPPQQPAAGSVSHLRQSDSFSRPDLSNQMTQWWKTVGIHSFLENPPSSPTIWPGLLSPSRRLVAPKLPWGHSFCFPRNHRCSHETEISNYPSCPARDIPVWKLILLKNFQIKTLWKGSATMPSFPLRTASWIYTERFLHMKAYLFSSSSGPPPPNWEFKLWNKKIDINKLLKLNSSQSLHMKKWFMKYFCL